MTKIIIPSIITTVLGGVIGLLSPVGSYLYTLHVEIIGAGLVGISVGLYNMFGK